MDTHSDTAPSAHLSTVRQLLRKLDEMKDGKVGAQERLEFLLENGTKVVHDFDYRDAFDTEMRSMTDRLRNLAALETDLRSFKANWATSPLDGDTKHAGDELVGHLNEFVKQALRRESLAEIEMLGQVWDSSPDVGAAFGMPAPDYGPKKQALGKLRQSNGSDEARKLDEVRDVLEHEVAGENLEMPPEVYVDLDLDEELKKKAKAKEIHVREVAKIGASHEKAEAVPHETVVSQVVKERLKPAPPAPEVLEEEMGMLDIQSWTKAFNDVLASNWKFDRQLRGRIGDNARMGLTLIWSKGDERLRLDVERLGDDEVLVRLVPPRSTKRWSLEDEEKMYQVHAREMKVAELEELHGDPSGFVKLILR